MCVIYGRHCLLNTLFRSTIDILGFSWNSEITLSTRLFPKIETFPGAPKLYYILVHCYYISLLWYIYSMPQTDKSFSPLPSAPCEKLTRASLLLNRSCYRISYLCIFSLLAESSIIDEGESFEPKIRCRRVMLRCRRNDRHHEY